MSDSSRSEPQPLAIDVRGIRRVYNVKPTPVVALEGVDLTVEPGEFFGLLGPERRRQDDAHQDPDDAAPAVERDAPGSSASTSSARRSRSAGS